MPDDGKPSRKLTRKGYIMSNDTIKNAAVTETAPSEVLTSTEDPMELAISSDRFQALDLTADLSTGNAGYCSMQAADDEDRVKLYNACSSPLSVADMINKQIRLRHIFVEVIQVMSEQSGELVYVPRVILIDEKGVGYQAVSIGMYNSVKRLIATFGDPSTWTKAHTVEIANVSLKNGQHTFNLKLID